MVTMEVSAMDEGGKKAKRDLGTEYAVGPTTLPLSAILGIAIGGALLLFAVLVTVGIIHVKRKHRRSRNQVEEANEDGNADIDLKTALRSTRPPPTSLVQRLSFNPFLPHSEEEIREEWIKHDGLQRPPLAKSRSISQRGFLRTSSVRDSWPLMSNNPLGYLPGQTAMALSTVAPPGYVVQDQKWPKRTTSILGRKRSHDSSKTSSPTRDPYPMDTMPYRKVHSRSTSESQLSTILRSTSHRLKGTQRHSMTRTLSTFGRFPGLPPSERLPTPPMRRGTESRDGLVDQEIAESVGNSIDDIYALTPSPKKKHRRMSSKRSPVKPMSPTESVESKDRLCDEKLSMAIPAPLTSPTRSPSQSGQKIFIKQGADGAKDISTQIHQDFDDLPLFATDPPEISKSHKIVSPPKRTSLSGDPFYSSARSSKPMIPSPQIQGPKPMYFRSATFGHEVTSERPAGFSSPLRDVSGNVQSPTKRELPEPPISTEPNPFQWHSEEAMQTRATQTGLKKSNPRRKGHKRSNVIRMSNLSRPTSTVEIVPEEPEEFDPLKYNVPRYSPTLNAEVSQESSPTKSPVSRRTSQRPPSIATFNPTLIVLARSNHSENDPSRLGADRMSDTGYSPTIPVCNSRTEKDSGSEDELFKPRVSTSPQPSPSVMKSRRHGRNYSAELAIFPTHQSQQYLQERLLSSPPLPVDIVPDEVVPPPQILTQRPKSPPLPNITSDMNGLRSSAATPAPPILTIPKHLTGPRSEPGKHTQATLSPPRSESMLSTISMLRRMNSEVSAASLNSSTRLDPPTLYSGSPFPPRSSSKNIAFGLDISIIEENEDVKIELSSKENTSPQERGRSRGSLHYLSLGQTSPSTNASPSARTRVREKATGRQTRHTRPRLEIRDSHHIHKERRQKRKKEMNGAGMVDELEAVEEMSSPPSGATADVRGSGSERGPGRGSNAGLRFPTLSLERSMSGTPPMFMERSTARRSGLRLDTPEIEGLATQINNSTIHVDEDSALLQSIESDTEPYPNEPELPPHGKSSRLSVLSEISGNEGSPRWSAAMTKPTTHAVRRESKMKHPSPVTPPKWNLNPSLSGLGLAGVRLLERNDGGRVGFSAGAGAVAGAAAGADAAAGGKWGEEGEEGGGTGWSRPSSLGLYDQDGFLKCSPEREKVLAARLAEERREKKGKDRKKESYGGFVM